MLYSLKTGDVALSYKDRRVDYKVEVVLFGEDKDGNSVEYHLNKSDTVEVKHRLRFIHGQPDVYPIAEIESGKYKGKLIVTEQDNMREIKCRIKALDREIRERENK